MPRAKAFSGKKKKVQLRAKRIEKMFGKPEHDLKARASAEYPLGEAKPKATDSTLANSIAGTKRARTNKLLSVWELKGAAAKDLAVGNEPVIPLDSNFLEIGFEDFISLPIPTRPAWSYTLALAELEAREVSSFQSWLDSIYSENVDRQTLSYFEHNLEVWRQLWRVCEMSDIIVVVVDARNPALHFPQSLYEYVVKVLKRQMVVALMKADLIREEVLCAWKRYFQETFADIYVVDVSIYSKEPEVDEDGERKKKARRYYHARGVAELLETCSKIPVHKEKISLDWETIIARCRSRMQETAGSSGAADECETEFEDQVELESHDNDEPAVPEHLHASDAYLTIGMIGHPNVGKSSLINSIVGKKVVSASRTPGHTKHFQTIHMSSTVRLCDCPGLIFPILVPRSLQILSGLFNLAQVRDPYVPIRYLAERLDLPHQLGITLPEDQDEWTSRLMCEQYAEQRGFFTSRAARPDAHRAANMILRSVNDGRILLSWRPRGFSIERHREGKQPGLASYQPPSHDKLVESQDNILFEEESGSDSDSDSKSYSFLASSFSSLAVDSDIEA